MNGTALLKEPIDCTEGERLEFARLVREGFPAARSLESRIRQATCLAFYYTAGDMLTAVAALKAPTDRYRERAFRQAGARVSPAEYPLELGWVFVVPPHRRNGIAEGLCRHLVARASTSGVFATTRPDNVSMIRILGALGFVRVGEPYPRRNEELVLYVRQAPPADMRDAAPANGPAR